jgi:hypothetical protein
LAGGTLYASGNDTPPKASRRLHDSPRLGEAGGFLTVAEGMHLQLRQSVEDEGAEKTRFPVQSVTLSSFDVNQYMMIF